MKKHIFSPIENAISEIAAGKLIILVDDDHRENEGDLVFAAEKCTPELVNAMMCYGRGLICQPMSAEDTRRLNLPQQVYTNEAQLQTAFTVSIDAAKGIGTGISASDRCKTILAACSSNAKASDLVRPGHIFPLEAKDGGCLVRPGHTEASVDLVRLAGLKSQAVICEILNDQGEASNKKELFELGEALGLHVYRIKDLINYRLKKEPVIKKIESVQLPTDYGAFNLSVYQNTLDAKNEIYLALTHGEEKFDSEVPLVRVHSEWSIISLVNRLSHESGSRLNVAMKKIVKYGCGVVLFLRHTPEVSDNWNTKCFPADILKKNDILQPAGGPAPNMGYGIGAQILKELGVKKMKILSNSDFSFKGIGNFDLEISEKVPFDHS